LKTFFKDSYNKTKLDALISQIHFWNKTLMFRTVPLSIIRSFSLYTQKTCMTYTIAVCTVKNSVWWTEELSETLEFYSKNEFEKLVHLVAFIIRIYYDVWSFESLFLMEKLVLFVYFQANVWFRIYSTDISSQISGEFSPILKNNK